ncbi:MAG: hypothetical protein WEA09_13045 [Gemmatimonadota bacterium]
MSRNRNLSALDRLRADVGDLVERHGGQEEDFTPYANDPVGFIREVLGETKPGPWSAQIEIAEAVRDYPLVVVRGNNSSGKDWLSARLALWWVYARKGLALVTGPTQRQVKEIVMAEVGRAFHRSKRLPGELFQLALRVGADEQRGILAFTSSEASKLTGFHAPRVMCFLTEAQGVEDFAWEGVLSCATGDEDRILAVGNPLSPSGRFYDASGAKHWKAIKISALSHPNLKEGRSVIPGGPTALWVERISQEYGAGSGTYRSRVEGEFPDQGEESLFKRSWLEEAATRHEEGAYLSNLANTAPIVAVDPARYGPDASALAVRRGPILQRIVTWRGASTMETVDRVIQELTAEHVYPRGSKFYNPKAKIVVDVVGLGAGVADRLQEKGYNVTSYNGGQFMTSVDREKYLNERARSHWTLRKLLEDGEIAIPRDERLFDEIMSVNWCPTNDGKVQIERKDALKGRLGRSPDRADAVVMAFGVDALPGPAIFTRYRV